MTGGSFLGSSLVPSRGSSRGSDLIESYYEMRDLPFHVDSCWQPLFGETGNPDPENSSVGAIWVDSKLGLTQNPKRVEIPVICFVRG